jgi:hypothetical protein
MSYQNAKLKKEERVKQIAVFVCLVLCLVATSASAQAIRNPGFDTDLSYWWLCHGLTNYDPTGQDTVAWEGAGSVLLGTSGSPGSIALAQPTCKPLNAGDSAWVNFTVVNQQYSTISLVLGDQNGDSANGQIAQINEPSPGSYHLVIHANKVYPQGTWYQFQLLCWPGQCTVRVSRADAPVCEERAGASPVARPAMSANPNPATGRTTVCFSTPQSRIGRLAVYDAAGGLVRNVQKRLYGAGQHTAVWNGRDESGSSVSPGTYFIKLTTEDGREETASVVVTR